MSASLCQRCPRSWRCLQILSYFVGRVFCRLGIACCRSWFRVEGWCQRDGRVYNSMAHEVGHTGNACGIVMSVVCPGSLDGTRSIQSGPVSGGRADETDQFTSQQLAKLLMVDGLGSRSACGIVTSLVCLGWLGGAFDEVGRRSGVARSVTITGRPAFAPKAHAAGDNVVLKSEGRILALLLPLMLPEGCG